MNEQILKYLKPEITLDPEIHGIALEGLGITLNSQAEGRYLTYQWYKNGERIPGANKKRYEIEALDKTLHEGNYSIEVSNEIGSLKSYFTPLEVGKHRVELNSTVSIDMIWCPPGQFKMGSPTTEPGHDVDETQHQVTLTKGFYLGKYEVTRSQYKTLLGKYRHDAYDESFGTGQIITLDGDLPVAATLSDAYIFCNALTERERSAGRLPSNWEYYLPTEAQWEYACRAGTTTAYSWGDTINPGNANWNHGNNIKQIQEIGKYSPNPWGFYDMHGNASEWTSDSYRDSDGNLHEWTSDDYDGSQLSSSLIDPSRPVIWTNHAVLRGGAFDSPSWLVRSASRFAYGDDSVRFLTISFRVALREIPIDRENPEIRISGKSVVRAWRAGKSWVDPGYVARDARDGDITDRVLVTGIVDSNRAGTYLLTYSVQDGAGNSATTTRTVTVVGNRTVDLNATVAMDMIWCPPGTFTMGSPTTEAGRGTDENQTEVTLTRGFYLGKYEVTQAQYEAVMKGNSIGMNPNPSQELGSDHPVEFVSRVDIEAFVNVFNNQHPELINQGWKFVLPTEAEWEYACRAGTNTVYSWGNGINPSNANYVGSGFGKIKEVGKYAPNPWGFYDMHGNIIEWVSDWYGSYALGPIVDPTGPGSGSRGTLRGGSYSSWYPVRAAQRIPVNSVGYKHTGAGGFGFRISLKKFVHSG